MKSKEIENIILMQFDFLKKIGYDKIDVFSGTEGSYDFGVTMTNQKLNLKFSIAYYSSNPIVINNHNNALIVKLFKDSEHIDFSRLISNINEAKSINQYFVLNRNEELSILINKIASLIQINYIELFEGKKWISLKYDLRDDY